MGDLINEILTKLKALTDLQTVTIWNSQFELIDNGGDFSFAMPCAFVELITGELQDIGNGYQGSDVNLNIHIGQNYFNGDNISENLTIFDLRDLVVKQLFKFQPSKCSIFVKESEEQDFNHSNVYLYILSYKFHWIDNTTVLDETTITNPNLIINNG